MIAVDRWQVYEFLFLTANDRRVPKPWRMQFESIYDSITAPVVKDQLPALMDADSHGDGDDGGGDKTTASDTKRTRDDSDCIFMGNVIKPPVLIEIDASSS